MYLVFGGAFSGKSEFSKSIQENEMEKGYKMIVIDHMERIVMENLSIAKANVRKIVEENPNSIIICDEIGCGLVPIDKTEREYREILGEITVELAQKSDKVFYVTLGIGQQIK